MVTIEKDEKPIKLSLRGKLIVAGVPAAITAAGVAGTVFGFQDHNAWAVFAGESVATIGILGDMIAVSILRKPKVAPEETEEQKKEKETLGYKIRMAGKSVKSRVLNSALWSAITGMSVFFAVQSAEGQQPGLYNNTSNLLNPTWLQWSPEANLIYYGVFAGISGLITFSFVRSAIRKRRELKELRRNETLEQWNAK